LIYQLYVNRKYEEARRESISMWRQSQNVGRDIVVVKLCDN
jgi:hypothetical protein